MTHAGNEIGGGHLSRCFALSQGLRESGVASSWALNRASRAQVEKLNIEEARFVDDPFAVDHDQMARMRGFDFVIVDSYTASRRFYAEVSKIDPLVVIDDLGNGADEFASIVINYGVGAKPSMYPNRNAKQILGPHYALIRKDYWNLPSCDGGYVMLIPGASDVGCAAEKFIGLWRNDWPELMVVLGPLVPEARRHSVGALAECRKNNLSVQDSPLNFARLMANAGAIFCTSSVTAYEALALKKRVGVFSVVDNQAGLGALLAKLNAAFDFGTIEDVDECAIGHALAYRPDEKVIAGLVDPRGALCCAQEIVQTIKAMKEMQ